MALQARGQRRLAVAKTVIATLLALPAFSNAMDPLLAERIRTEALRKSNDPIRPLPFLSSWLTGDPTGSAAPGDEKAGPRMQLQMLREGYPLIPWFQMPKRDQHPQDPKWVEHYEEAIKFAAQHRLPIAFVGLQWELPLLLDARFRNLPAAERPTAFWRHWVEDKSKPEGGYHVITHEHRLSPMGPVEHWRTVGSEATATAWLKRLQELYPDPPLVLFVSNNEAQKLEWANAWMDDRLCTAHDCKYLYQPGALSAGRDELRKLVGDLYAERYRAMQSSMRDNLVSDGWKRAARFIGYDAFGPRHYGTWEGWLNNSISTANRIDPAPITWDGGAPSYYLFEWRADAFDNQVFSPQVEAQNWVFMHKEALRMNPDFWFELSTWDGATGTTWVDKRRQFARRGEAYTPDRYHGMVQFGLWLTRARGLRDFRGWTETRGDSEEFLRANGDAIRAVHTIPTLTRFWREGELVENRNHPAPRAGLYQQWQRPEYRNEARWFVLNTSADPTGTYTLHTQLPVLSMALVRGSAPNRQWLLHAHAPAGDRGAVGIDLPLGGDTVRRVTVDVAQRGSFYVVTENGGVQRIDVPRSATGLVAVNAATWSTRMTNGSIIAAFGQNLGQVDRVTLELGEPSKGTTLASTRVSCVAGEANPAPNSCRLLYVSPTQLNIALPKLRTAGKDVLALPKMGGAQLRAYRGDSLAASGWVPFASSAPTIFAADVAGDRLRLVTSGVPISRFLAGNDDVDAHCYAGDKATVRAFVNGSERPIISPVVADAHQMFDEIFVDVSGIPVGALQNAQIETFDCFEQRPRSNVIGITPPAQR